MPEIKCEHREFTFKPEMYIEVMHKDVMVAAMCDDCQKPLTVTFDAAKGYVEEMGVVSQREPLG